MRRAITFLFLLNLFFLSGHTSGQKYKEPMPAPPLKVPRNNVFYFELLGSGGPYSLNFERYLFQTSRTALSSRIGLSYFPDAFSAPVMLMGMLTLKDPWSLEAGGGTLLSYNFSDGFGIRGAPLSLGTRYQDEDGILLRLNYTPFLIPRTGEDEKGHEWMNWLGMSVGMVF